LPELTPPSQHLFMRNYLRDLGGKRVREPLKLRNWNCAQDLVHRWATDGRKPTKKAQVTIEEWRDQFLRDATTSRRELRHDGLYKLPFRELISFATDGGSLANNMDLDALTKSRVTWDVGALTASKKLEHLRSIYKFALRRKMVDENYALDLVPPEVKEKPTLPSATKRCCGSGTRLPPTKRIPGSGFILTMRYSGLRISDVATLSTIPVPYRLLVPLIYFAIRRLILSYHTLPPDLKNANKKGRADLPLTRDRGAKSRPPVNGVARHVALPLGRDS
jgi:hypothetical protein